MFKIFEGLSAPFANPRPKAAKGMVHLFDTWPAVFLFMAAKARETVRDTVRIRPPPRGPAPVPGPIFYGKIVDEIKRG